MANFSQIYLVAKGRQFKPCWLSQKDQKEGGTPQKKLANTWEEYFLLTRGGTESDDVSRGAYDTNGFVEEDLGASKEDVSAVHASRDRLFQAVDVSSPLFGESLRVLEQHVKDIREGVVRSVGYDPTDATVSKTPLFEKVDEVSNRLDSLEKLINEAITNTVAVKEPKLSPPGKKSTK